jgi:hypothetical protein
MGERSVEKSNPSDDDVVNRYGKQNAYKGESTEHSDGIEHRRKRGYKKIRTLRKI